MTVLSLMSNNQGFFFFLLNLLSLPVISFFKKIVLYIYNGMQLNYLTFERLHINQLTISEVEKNPSHPYGEVLHSKSLVLENMVKEQ